MKAGRTFKCLFWVILYGNLCLVNANVDDDLMDFDFTDLKEIDWNYEIDTNSSNGTLSPSKTGSDNWQTAEHVVTFNAKDDEDAENQVHPFDWREKVLRNALSKALTNKKMRQKFVEIMPILRALSRQQRLALSAIVSAQVNAKRGHELKLEQVRMIFGDDKKLLIPIIYDIANLVGGSARKHLQYAYEVFPASSQKKAAPSAPQIERRKLDYVDSEEVNDEDVGALPSAAMLESSLEDFLNDVSEDVLDPLSINEELQASSERTNSTTPETTIRAKRLRRDANANANSFIPTDFVHKLIRSMPLTVNEEDLQQGAAGRTVRLNTTSFVAPSQETEFHATNVLDESKATLSYQEIEDLAFASLNGTEINLSNSGEMENESNSTENEPLPNPEELIAGPRYRVGGNKVRYTRPKMPPLVAKRKRVNIPRTQTQRFKGPTASGSSLVLGATSVPAPRKCERFTSLMCIRTEDYPLEQIMGSIRRHKNAMTALLAEYNDKPIQSDLSEEVSEFSYNQRRREDDAATEGGGTMCQSIVRYARPQKARSASGEWKYIVNTGQHTQTLRLEKCSHPQESCSYLAHNYRSHCAQIYNYHRLLSWDKTRGLHVDIFKVPTCCSCQIDGYRPQFPPLDVMKVKDYSPAVAAYQPDPYSTINEEIDYNDDEDENDPAYQLNNKYTQHKRGSGSNHGFDVNELQLGSKNVRIKTHAPNPTVGSYLTPPGSNEYDTNYAYKSGHHYHRATSSSAPPSRHSYSQPERRRPYKSLNHGYDSESFGDLEFAPSEKYVEKEVNIFGTNHANDKTRQVQQKRKHIYSVPYTATSTSSTGSSSGHSTAGLSSTFTPILEHGQRNGHGIEYKRAEHGQILSRSSSTAAITHQTAATVPTYYTSKLGKQNIHKTEGGRSKIPFTPSATAPPPPVFASAAAPASTQSHEPSSATATPSTTEYAVHRQSVASVQSGYPALYHIGTVFNNSNGGHDASVGGGAGAGASGGSKRINYSYHPIIDFFESNSHRFLSPSSTLSNPAPDLPTVTAYDASPPSSPSSSFTRASQSSPHEQFFPHKIPKYSSVPLSNSANELPLQTDNPERNGLLQQRERRIGVGGGGGGVVVAGGVSFGRVSGKGRQNPKASASMESNVWQPVLVK